MTDRWKLVLGAGCFSLLVSNPALAAAPPAYAIAETVALFGPMVNVEVMRDGNRVVYETTAAAAAAGARATHIRTFYDLEAHKSYTRDLLNTAAPCSGDNYKGDWGDPFEMSDEMWAETKKPEARALPNEKFLGLSAKVFEIPDAQTKATSKVWFDEKTGLLLKAVATDMQGGHSTLIEVKRFSTSRPDAARLQIPAECLSPQAPPIVLCPDNPNADDAET
jgi:hypothetical protein